ncbi:MAG: (4Fe-4S)-binding protein [Clostridiales bacterium GWF2_38_85]|nr:MAG: (4Fe-4S)-binding protein [Clostridiales bacterium GWF2_38_85]HBL84522.1 (4Fe-4S)-binding protein [Clostridiales bacterium]
MKQIVFISGKGGTGKSTLVASLSRLVNNKMLADCDVDTPNLHILLEEKLIEQNKYYGAKEAIIEKDKCVRCGICRRTCLFDAIDEDFNIILFRCEGCGACTLICSADAIKLEAVKTGNTFISETDRGTFSHALLDIGAEGSGKLVTEVRKNANKYEKGEDWLLIDGSPGIGCVVIASITGCDAVVVVTEPTISGLSDMVRVLGVAKHFGIPGYICINKFDLNIEMSTEIENFCEKNGYPVIGRIPFEPKIVEALRQFKTPVEAGLVNITDEIKSIWERLKTDIDKEKV